MGSESMATNASLIQTLSEHYGIVPTRWRAYDSLTKSHAAIHVHTDDGNVMLKPFHQTVHDVSFVTEALQHLSSYGYRHSPNLWRTRSGERYVTIHHVCYYATDWVSGRLFDGSHSTLRRLGRALGDLHEQPLPARTSTGLSPTREKLESLRNYQHGFELCAGLEGQHATLERRWFAEQHDEFARHTERAWRALDDPEVAACLDEEGSRPAWTHGDVTRYNVIVRPSREVCLIDWDRVRIGSAYFELVNALGNTCRFDPGAMKAFLTGYERHRPLRMVERRLVAALFRLPREVWYARQWHTSGVNWNDTLAGIVRMTWDERKRAQAWLDHWSTRGDGT